jgi:small subunit ribosomal protein S27Ae
MGKEKKTRKRGKKKRTGRKHESLKRHSFYTVEGGKTKRLRTSCPRCGPGTFLGKHKNRLYCGRCGYTELQRSK